MPDPARIVSLEPAATVTLRELGVADRLVGVTAHCRGELDDAGDPTVLGGWLDPDLDRLDDLDPDLVCTGDALQAEVRDAVRDRGIAVHHTTADTLDSVIEGFAALGRAVGCPDAGERLAERSRNRLRRVRERVPEDDRPTIYCEEWSDPPMAAGNWVPEAVATAGGRYPFVDPGERSRPVDGSEVAAADPDHAVLHVCGHGERVDPATIADREWAADPTVHVVDDSLLNQPSPTLIDGVERLADLLH
ncbi:helical backbone metal receptor [Haloplanus salilacus]|uniref:helical backbone metal receptor n=1 Tax=Haloplanus salilacus TaxID=2949994 RepID=UPI0030CBCFB5